MKTVKGFGYKDIKTGRLKPYFGKTEAQVLWYLKIYERTTWRKAFIIVPVEMKEQSLISQKENIE